MRNKDLSEKNLDEIVSLFSDLCIAQDIAEKQGKNTTYNKLMKQVLNLDNELKARGPEARLALVSLYEHPNFQVRLLAAQCTLAIVPKEACRILAAIKKTEHLPQSLAAGMSLWGYETGFFTPT